MSEIMNNENNTSVESEKVTEEKTYDPIQNDALMQLVNKHKKQKERGEEPDTVQMIHKEIPLVDDDNKIISVDSDAIIKNEKLSVADTTNANSVPVTSPTSKVDDDDEFGDNDMQKEIEAEEARELAERKAAYEAQKKLEEEARKKKDIAPRHNDPKAMGESIGFQADKIAMINRMTQMVLKKWCIKEGEIPESYPEEGAGKHLTRLQCLGELTALYEANGAIITTEFEQIILNNWKMNNGQFAIDWVKEHTTTDENGEIVLNDNPTTESSDNESTTSTSSSSNEPAVINIFTPEDVTSVTVNIDEDVLGEMTFSDKINVHVVKVTEQQMFVGKKIIENSDKPGIIREFTSSSNDVQFTLPASGYRATMTGINWFDTLGLADIAGKNTQDREIEQWSMFYTHMKNVSIGEFKDFNDFLKKTKYVDGSVIMWALLTATTGDEEEFGYQCTNPKCKKTFAVKYNPHSVAHINKDNITDEYFRASKASPGEEALAVFNEMGGHTLYYTLPDSKILLELSQPSAWDMINNKLSTQSKLEKQLKLEYENAEDPEKYQGAKLQYYMGINQFVDSIIIPGETCNYKYTTWDDKVKILGKLSWNDSNMLSPLMSALAKRFQSPIDMYIENVDCPHCGKHIERLVVTNIQSQLLFNASRRYQNTEINLIETL